MINEYRNNVDSVDRLISLFIEFDFIVQAHLTHIFDFKTSDHIIAAKSINKDIFRDLEIVNIQILLDYEIQRGMFCHKSISLNNNV